MGKLDWQKFPANKKPLVSVVVTTKNEEDVLGKLLESIRNQSYKNIEVIVVDNDSSDSTKKIARGYSSKVYNFGPERSAQRNFGAKKSKGNLLLILDADMELTPSVIKEGVELLNQTDRLGAATILEDSVAGNFWESVKAFERSFYNLEGDELTDAARFFRSEVFKETGGYDEEITGPEDWDLTERVKKKGYKVGIVKAKIIHHERVKSLLGLLKKKYYYALKSYPYLNKQQISVVSPKTIYFLRPVFYRNWKLLLSRPIISLAMFLMLGLENLAGLFGFLRGRFK